MVRFFAVAVEVHWFGAVASHPSVGRSATRAVKAHDDCHAVYLAACRQGAPTVNQAFLTHLYIDDGTRSDYAEPFDVPPLSGHP